MDVAQDLIYNTSRYIHSKLLITIFKLMMPIENSILLKSHVSCNFMLKYYITILFRQFTETLNQFLDLYRANENLEIYMPV